MKLDPYFTNRCKNGLLWLKKNFPNISRQELAAEYKRRLFAEDDFHINAPLILEMFEVVEDVLTVEMPVAETPLAQALRGIAGKVTTHEESPTNVTRSLDVSRNVAAAYKAQQCLEERMTLPFLGTARDL